MSGYSDSGPQRLHLPDDQMLVKMRDKAVKNLQSAPRKSSLCVPHTTAAGNEETKQRRRSFVRFDAHAPEIIERLSQPDFESDKLDAESKRENGENEKKIAEETADSDVTKSADNDAASADSDVTTPDSDVIPPPSLQEHRIRRWTDSLKIKRKKSKDEGSISQERMSKDQDSRDLGSSREYGSTIRYNSLNSNPSISIETISLDDSPTAHNTEENAKTCHFKLNGHATIIKE